MLQIIGWLGCVYLLVKALEIFSSSSFRNEAGKLKESAVYAVAIALLSAGGFALWLNYQGTSFPDMSAASQASERTAPSIDAGGVVVNDCTAKARNDDEMRECNR